MDSKWRVGNKRKWSCCGIETFYAFHLKVSMKGFWTDSSYNLVTTDPFVTIVHVNYSIAAVCNWGTKSVYKPLWNNKVYGWHFWKPFKSQEMLKCEINNL